MRAINIKDAQLRLVLDGVFLGLSNAGPLVVDVSGAQSRHIPEATGTELWQFVMNLWVGIQKRPAQSAQLEWNGLFLFAPDGLPTEKTVRDMMQGKASFLSADALAMRLGVYADEAEALAHAFAPKLVRTRGGLYGYLGWTQPQMIKAIAEQLARHGHTEWHFSQMGKALAYFDERKRGTKPRNVAAVVSRPEVDYFELAGRDGYWRLRALGDGHANNLEAIRAVIRASPTPLHWTDIQEQLERNVRDATLYALLSREEEFVLLWRGVFGLRDREYPESQREEAFMRQLFEQSGTESLAVGTVFAQAEAAGIEPAALLTVGRFSDAYRYWKWGIGKPMFVTYDESLRRSFTSWLLHHATRRIPSDEVLTEGLRATYEARDISALKKAASLLADANHPAPASARGWLAWGESH